MFGKQKNKVWPEKVKVKVGRETRYGRKSGQGSDEQIRDFILKTMRNH